MNDASFLRGIAGRPGDDLPRVVYADWLDEQGHGPRAGFIRVQCELAAPTLAADRRADLKARERALLDAHRREWIDALGVPADDVRFERGIVAAVRLPKWDSFADPQFAAVTILDLSGAGLGDDGLQQFVERAHFPALRKLMLNGNVITNAGAALFAKAKGLPALETLYLFDNLVDDAGRAALKSLKVKNLDLGVPAEGYELAPGQADAARRKYIREVLLPAVSEYFRKHDLLQSAMLCVAQYWFDEADDAVHGNLIISEHPEPKMIGARIGWGDEEGADSNLPNTPIVSEYGGIGSVLDLFGHGWDRNGRAISLWAPFASEGASQEDELADAYSPAVMFYRHGGYDILPMLRPQLDGIRPEWHED